MYEPIRPATRKEYMSVRGKERENGNKKEFGGRPDEGEAFEARDLLRFFLLLFYWFIF